ncbi:Possible colicin V production protein [Marinilactibacillus psychrotolerans 42ea]|uniref:Possible colicin V production protein n=1 Tax=Marinilactibacillus psychrotolerans 42ea TaxID=1255609 RepID=A0A1R4IEC7_9LACT|nr:CvpA family protein [Marinilactibacillus psychrotolerans]SJN18089.1 Possible colicin V production protein [Marinilactibacillus psychrotolerans 42ea]
MLLSLIILLLLLLSLYSGFKKGLILQLVLTIGYAISFYFALEYYQEVSNLVEMMVPYPSPVSSNSNPFVLYGQEFIFNLDQGFYNGVAFIGILVLGWIVTRFIGGLLNFLTEIPVVKQINGIGGAIVGFIVQYIGIFLILFLLSMIPIKMIQSQFESSALARTIVSDTPELSTDLYNWWIEEGLQEDTIEE